MASRAAPGPFLAAHSCYFFVGDMAMDAIDSHAAKMHGFRARNDKATVLTAGLDTRIQPFTDGDVFFVKYS